MRRHGTLKLWLILLAFSAAVPAHAAEPVQKPGGMVACDVSAYTVDPDPKGANIRSAPDRSASVLAVIPHDPEGTVVDIAASHGDWVLVRSAEGLTKEFRFEGEGWVSARLLAVRAGQSSGRVVPLRERPVLASRGLKRLAAETEVRLTGCKEGWVHVTAGGPKGWLAPGDYCGNPVTTCP